MPTWALPMRARAAWMMSVSMPRREAMFRALDLPGMPHMSRYVGASLASSNSTLAFSKRSSWYFRDVSELQVHHCRNNTENLLWVLASMRGTPRGSVTATAMSSRHLGMCDDWQKVRQCIPKTWRLTQSQWSHGSGKLIEPGQML